MPYTIKDYNYWPGHVSYINDDSTSPEDGWTTTIPLNPTELKQTPTPPKIFSTKTEAKEYLDAVKSGWLSDWEKNSWYYKNNGRKKPQWKIYSTNSETGTP